MVAMIHDNTELPMIDVRGIYLGSGRKHKLMYKKRVYELQGAPYSRCTSDVPPAMRAMFERYNDTDYGYSPVLCNELCVQAYV